MSLPLTPELERKIAHLVSIGKYASPDEAIGEAIRLLEERDLREEETINMLRGEIQKGLDSGPAKETSALEFLTKMRK